MLKWNVVDYQLFSKTEWLDEIPKWQDKIPELPDISIPRFNVKSVRTISAVILYLPSHNNEPENHIKMEFQALFYLVEFASKDADKIAYGLNRIFDNLNKWEVNKIRLHLATADGATTYSHT
ncbi:hypothetical protein RCL_jg23862.t1 [Rhizophagus clarus]|uniref:Uncharacterized protein n=1 Tax=Rhizophagus clarus TaxID=94130 RepID=A0A8H3LQ13_9GLOM|nr:hypothetical protein RCL_jg23862.t1 [Rhizophagus clarus]